MGIRIERLTGLVRALAQHSHLSDVSDLVCRALLRACFLRLGCVDARRLRTALLIPDLAGTNHL